MRCEDSYCGVKSQDKMNFFGYNKDIVIANFNSQKNIMMNFRKRLK